METTEFRAGPKCSLCRVERLGELFEQLIGVGKTPDADFMLYALITLVTRKGTSLCILLMISNLFSPILWIAITWQNPSKTLATIDSRYLVS